MSKLLSKHTAPLQFQHAGQSVTCLPGVETECDAALLADLMKYEVVKFYFDSGAVVAIEAAPASEAPKKKGK